MSTNDYAGTLPEGVLQAQLAAIVASSDDAIISKDLDGVVQSWNGSAERIFGYTAEEMIGRPVAILVPADRPDEEPNILERLKRGERVDHFETVRVRKDGALVDVSVTISPIKDATGAIVGASKIARDITELTRLTRQREEMLASEQMARREAERANRIKDEFLATVSHELRTPLSAILGWAQLLKNPSVPADQTRRGLDTIERNARVQSQLIEDLLDMSSIVSGKIRLDVQLVDLSAIIALAAESVRPAADAKDIRLTLQLDPKGGPVLGDPSRLQQVLWNLLTNAVKFSRRGGRVQVALVRAESQVEITVNDDGEGIPEDFLPHLFDRFSQADASTTRKHGGLGLGLAIVRHLVELHGGTARAASEGVGKGASFAVTLPLRLAREERPAGGGSEIGEVPDLMGVRVLVVDDEPDARDLVQQVLQMANARVTAAGSAAEALELLRRDRPDVLVCDIGMPGEDGYELLARVRQLDADQGGETPAVALTAMARSEDRRKALMVGFQMHMAKPAEPQELVAVVASLSGPRRRPTRQ